jgi:hypothetical protein
MEVRDPREYQWIRRYLCNGVNLDLQKERIESTTL